MADNNGVLQRHYTMEDDMNSQFGFIAIRLIGLLVLLSIMSCGGSQSDSEAHMTFDEMERCASRFFDPDLQETVSIIEFTLHTETESGEKKSYTITDKEELKSLNHKLCHPTTSPFDVNVPGVTCYMDYSCTFSDNASLHYQAALRFYRERTYLRMYFPEDNVWMEGRNRYIRLDGVVSDKAIKEVRDLFLDGTEPPAFKRK